MALFAALLCVSAYISISLPIPGAPHLTLVNFMVLLISFVLPAFQPALVVAVWMLLGIVGVPVFIGGATGIGYLIGPWGGYTLSFIVVAILAPIVRGKKYNRIKFNNPFRSRSTFNRFSWNALAYIYWRTLNQVFIYIRFCAIPSIGFNQGCCCCTDCTAVQKSYC